MVQVTRLMLLTATLLFTSIACSHSHRVALESPPAYQPTAEAPQLKLPEVAAPKIAEVEDAVERVFKDMVVVDKKQKPSFISGDFNGDSSRDLAVIIKPAEGRTVEMNTDLQPWILRDPLARESNHPIRLQIEPNETLLAVMSEERKLREVASGAS